MKARCHLIVSSTGSTRSTKNVPALSPDEIAVGIDLDIPDRYFRRPYPVVQINFPDPPTDPDPAAAIHITARTIADALKLDVTEVTDGLTKMVERQVKEAFRDVDAG